MNSNGIQPIGNSPAAKGWMPGKPHSLALSRQQVPEQGVNSNISSNKESGDGYSDILIEIEDEETGIIIEIKYAQDGDLEKSCQKALDQIEANHYEDQLREDGICRILKYGIACFKKCCRIVSSL